VGLRSAIDRVSRRGAAAEVATGQLDGRPAGPPGGKPGLTSRGDLVLPAQRAGSWDVDVSHARVLTLRLTAGRYSVDAGEATRAREAHEEGRWQRLARHAAEDGPASRLEIAGVEPAEPPLLTFDVPGTCFPVGEHPQLRVHPPDAAAYELRSDGGEGDAYGVVTVDNQLALDGSRAGTQRFRVRYLAGADAGIAVWSDWSRTISVSFAARADEQALADQHAWTQGLELICVTDARGTSMLTDPLGWPPGCPRDEPVRWFRIPCYEGATSLLNEQTDYYRDPAAYYLSCIRQLIDQGARFVTWRDVLAGRTGNAPFEVVLQFDIDGGPRAMRRLFGPLHDLGVRATLMVHREASVWYAHRVEDIGLDWLAEVERCGWELGYHNNALTEVQQQAGRADYAGDLLARACERFERDVAFLQEHLDVRTFTHHGGNTLNWRTPVPAGLAITCVDRPQNPAAWTDVVASFSDGGFLARPTTLSAWCRAPRRGLHFVRNHPLKYAGYQPPLDVPPATLAEAQDRGLAHDDLGTSIAAHTALSRRWLADRLEHRLGTRASFATLEQPVRGGLMATEELEPAISTFRARRSAPFRREYPLRDADPRVTWWRMLATHAPKSGRILNVGALPPERRDETTAFTGQADVVEIDVDAERAPDLLGDVTDPALVDELEPFDAVLAFGLPYIPSPSRAIENALRLLRPQGVLLSGFAASTHPTRGAFWNRDSRPLWRAAREPLRDVGLRGNLWSFDRIAAEDLLRGWPRAALEFHHHYWFAVARRS
jgi:hypothetical protein